MNAKRAMPWVVAMLVLLGAAGVALRVQTQREMQLSPGDTLWRLTYTVTFHAAQSGGKIRAAIPADTVQGRIFRQDLLYSGLTTEHLRPVHSQTREIGLAAMNAGNFSLTARFDIHLSPRANWRVNEPDVSLPADVRAGYLKSTKNIQADSPKVLETLDRLRRDSATPSDLVRRAFDYCVKEIQPNNDSATSDAAASPCDGSPLPRGQGAGSNRHRFRRGRGGGPQPAVLGRGSRRRSLGAV